MQLDRFPYVLCFLKRFHLQKYRSRVREQVCKIVLEYKPKRWFILLQKRVEVLILNSKAVVAYVKYFKFPFGPFRWVNRNNDPSVDNARFK